MLPSFARRIPAKRERASAAGTNEDRPRYNLRGPARQPGCAGLPFSRTVTITAAPVYAQIDVNHLPSIQFADQTAVATDEKAQSSTTASTSTGLVDVTA